MNLDASFYLALCFIIFSLLAFKPIKSMICNMLDSKIDHIKADIKSSEKLRQEAEEILIDYHDKLDKIQDITQSNIKNAEKEAKKYTHAQTSKIEQEYQTNLRNALMRIELLKKETSKNFDTILINKADAIVRSYYQSKLSNNKDFDLSILKTALSK